MTPAPSRPAGVPSGTGRARADRYDKSALAGTDSDYLCLFCYDPLYVNDGTAEGVCFNRACDAYASRGEFSGDVSGDEGPERARDLCAESVRQFRRFSRGFAFRKLFEARAHECAKLFKGNDMNLGILSSIGYLLTRLSGNAEWGRSEDYSEFRREFDQYYDHFDTLQLVENLCSKYYITTANAEPYVIKYHRALQSFDMAFGLVNAGNRQDRAACYSFYDIDRKSGGRPAESAFDFQTIYDNSLTLVGSLNHIFKMGHDISKMHRYPSRSEDFAALFSVWRTCPPGGVGIITEERLREIYDGAAVMNNMQGDFGRFLEDYTSGHTYAPILVFDGERYYFDYPAMLLYLLYLFSNNTSTSGTQTEAGQTTYNKKRQVAAHHFEEKIRQKLRDDGFEVHPGPNRPQLRMSFDNAKTEFDCIAVDRAKKVIVLVEAKYEDISPSSKAGTTMVGQLVLDGRRGLLEHAKRHHRRRRLFKRHFASLKNFGLDLEESFYDYAVHTVIVTKHEPLISRHMGVDIVSHEKFMSADFRGDGGSPFRPPPASALSQMPRAPPGGPTSQGRPAGLASPSVASAGGGNGCDDGAAKRQGYVDRGDRLFKEKRYDKAYDAYKMAAGLGAPDAALHLRMAQSQTGMGLHEEALEHCMAAIRADPSNAAVHAATGRFLSALGRHAEALPHRLRAASLDPSSAQTHHDASFTLFHLERYEEALQHAKRAAEIAPEDPLAHERVSTCLSKMGLHEEAMLYGRRAIEAAPGRVDSYMPLVALLQRLDRHKEVLRLCGRAIEANRSDPRPHFVMALSLRALGRQEEALPHCLRAVKLDPTKTDFRALASYLLRDLGRFGEALPHCEAVVSTTPDDPRALSNMGGMLAELGRHEEALDCLDRAIRIEPTQAILHYNRGMSLQAISRLAEALEEYGRAAELDPRNTGAHNNAGIVLAEMDRDREALGHFDAAIALEPGNFGLYCNKAFSLQSLKMHREALGHFDRALELSPDNADARAGRLSCLSELGLPDKAIGRYAEELLGPAAPPPPSIRKGVEGQ